ncbi:MAG: hypothetical protein NVS4B8_13660 [Herpetosiphon sp.]
MTEYAAGPPRSDRNGQNFVDFVPGTIVILVEHPDAVAFGEIKAAVQRQIKGFLDMGALNRFQELTTAVIAAVGRLPEPMSAQESAPEAKHEAYGEAEREAGTESERAYGAQRTRGAAPIMTFGTSAEDTFSLFFVAGLEAETSTLIGLLATLNRQLIEQPTEAGGIVIKAFTPNWVGSCAQLIVVGGPGARPMPIATRSLDIDDKPWRFTFANNVLAESSEGVEVVVLDTAPRRSLLQRAYEQWHREHPLLRSLLGSTGHFDVDDPAGVLRVMPVGAPSWPAYTVDQHHYRMTDHGLFAAGIIHSIAPRAKIRLIEVLNPFGVGTFQTLSAGLQTAWKTSTKPCVVNCSLTMRTPVIDELEPQHVYSPFKDDCRILDLVGRPLEAVCAFFAAQGMRLVAAAGNEALGGQHPQARLPAAYASVTGVGALDRLGHATDYSNLADEPLSDGVATFGGVAPGTRLARAKARRSMLGIYIGSFPDGTWSSNGWGLWAGTSFAAPVVSGVLANLLSATDNTQLPQTRLHEAEGVFDGLVRQPPIGPLGFVLAAQQG